MSIENYLMKRFKHFYYIFLYVIIFHLRSQAIYSHIKLSYDITLTFSYYIITALKSLNFLSCRVKLVSTTLMTYEYFIYTRQLLSLGVCYIYTFKFIKIYENIKVKTWGVVLSIETRHRCEGHD